MHLTKAELDLMKYLWRLEKTFFKELRNQLPEPKPATTTITTVLKRLIEKNFVSYKLFGNSREYYPKLTKHQYFSGQINSMIKNHFNDSVEQFGSFFTKEIDVSEEDLKKLRDIVDNQIKNGL